MSKAFDYISTLESDDQLQQKNVGSPERYIQEDLHIADGTYNLFSCSIICSSSRTSTKIFVFMYLRGVFHCLFALTWINQLKMLTDEDEVDDDITPLKK